MLQKITREPALIVGVVTSGLGLAALFGLDLTAEQTAQIMVFLGAVMALVRFLTTPASEVLVQVKPDGAVVAGEAAVLPTGTQLEVYGPPHPASASQVIAVESVEVRPELVDERGHLDAQMAFVIVCLIGLGAGAGYFLG